MARTTFLAEIDSNLSPEVSNMDPKSQGEGSVILSSYRLDKEKVRVIYIYILL